MTTCTTRPFSGRLVPVASRRSNLSIPCNLHYWRDKTGREVGFVIARHRDQVDAIECKWDPTPTEFDPAGLKAFRALYPRGTNYLVSPLTTPAYLKQSGPLQIKVCDPSGIPI
jgi:hypothetical protein